MNKNLQYTIMSITGVLLIVIALSAFDSDSDTSYKNTQTIENTDRVDPNYGTNEDARLEVDIAQ